MCKKKEGTFGVVGVGYVVLVIVFVFLFLRGGVGGGGSDKISAYLKFKT